MAEYYTKAPSCKTPDGTEWFAGGSGNSVRHGKWEYRAVDTPNLGRRYEMYCTACGKTPDPKKWYDCCPNCGAKMDKENDNGKL